MNKLAIDGGKSAVVGPIKPYNSLDGGWEQNYVLDAFTGPSPLSGYIGGSNKTNKYVATLERVFRERFGVTHAVACNSASSGLFAACKAVELSAKDRVIVSPFTMSATAAAPYLCGAHIDFADIEPEHFCLDVNQVLQAMQRETGAIIATNLFGHPAELKKLAKYAHAHGAYLIEDNAQAIFATEDGAYAGTIGDIGVFSFNVHKHLQCGEGGVVVTDNDEFAEAVRRFINHAELYPNSTEVGLNLRMTELQAAVACAQMERSAEIIYGRADLSKKIYEATVAVDGGIISIPHIRKGCTNVCYVLPFLVHERVNRDWLVSALAAEGVPLCKGYVDPLYRLPAFSRFKRECPVAERMHDRDLIYFEVCGYDPTDAQIRQIGEAFAKVQAYADSQGWTTVPSDMAHG